MSAVRGRSPTRSWRPRAGWWRRFRQFFYNLLTQRVKLFASEMDDFAMEFLNIAERNLPSVPKVNNGDPRRPAARPRPSFSTSLSEINVVPMVDVMLVLLIIFMVAAPMIQRGRTSTCRSPGTRSR